MSGKSTLTKYVGQALGKQSLMEAVKSGGWKVVIDGNLGYVPFDFACKGLCWCDVAVPREVLGTA
jgi:hypothetical protein